ncbi:unnamed protein product [Gongylonema pulchrum]|uniref:Uncharacterized protein n=1 Tax=Gongylonema pulchrum TaxID=637853 RepID=A0A183D217_9BILA|nr:unnamed protein product [Gongylonema pulchrum]
MALQSSSATPPMLAAHRHSTPSHQATRERRRGFRMRGLSGATIASAPSVEHEDYRSPKPSDQIKNGKSFDYGNDTCTGASDSNALLQDRGTDVNR